MSVDRAAPRGYRKAWNGGAPPPDRVPFGTLDMLLEPGQPRPTVGEQLLVQPDERGVLVARRGLAVVARMTPPQEILAAIEERQGLALGQVKPTAPGSDLVAIELS